MKISVKQYARSIAESVVDKSESEQKIIIGRFLVLLKAQGKLSLADKIVAELEKQILAEQEIVEAEVQSARKLNEAILKDLIQMIKAKTHCQEVRLTELVDLEILGGVIVKYQDKIINFSLKYFLSKIKQAAIK